MRDVGLFYQCVTYVGYVPQSAFSMGRGLWKGGFRSAAPVKTACEAFRAGPRGASATMECKLHDFRFNRVIYQSCTVDGADAPRSPVAFVFALHISGILFLWRRIVIWSPVAFVFALHIPGTLFLWRRIGIRLSIGFAGSNWGHFCGNFQFSWNFCNFAVEFLKIDCICIML